MRGLAGPLTVVAARARRSRSWILPTLALAVVVGCAGAAVSESVIVGDQSARAMVGRLAPTDRAVRLVWEGPLTPYGRRTASAVFSRFGLRRPTQVLQLNPVRLSAVVVHPVAIEPLDRWLPASAAGRLGRCTAQDCNVLVGSPGRVPAKLTAAGVHMRIVGRTAAPAVALGYGSGAEGETPIVLTGDLAGLGSIGGLSGVYRTYSWVGLLPLAQLHSWSLPAFESRLRAAQAAVSPLSTRFTFEGPFFGLDAARARAKVASHRLLLVDGGVAVALILLHVALGQQMVAERAAGCELPREKLLALSHCILTHHGADGVPARRFGSPEALALFRLNALDASVKGALEHGLAA